MMYEVLSNFCYVMVKFRAELPIKKKGLELDELSCLSNFCYVMVMLMLDEITEFLLVKVTVIYFCLRVTCSMVC